MKNLNPLYEFLGHATAGAVGLIFGHGIAETKNDKEGKSIYKEKLKTDPIFLKGQVEESIKVLVTSIEEDKNNIKSIDEDTRMLEENSYEFDSLDTEEIEMALAEKDDITRHIQWCENRIKDIKRLYSMLCSSSQSNPKTILIDRLTDLLWYTVTKEVIKIKKKVSARHNVRSLIIKLGGIATGTIGYHFLKKAIISGIRRMASNK